MPNTPSQVGNNPDTSPETPGYGRPEDATNAAAEHAADRARQDAKRDNLARRVADGASGAAPRKIGGG